MSVENRGKDPAHELLIKAKDAKGQIAFVQYTAAEQPNNDTYRYRDPLVEEPVVGNASLHEGRASQIEKAVKDEMRMRAGRGDFALLPSGRQAYLADLLRKRSQDKIREDREKVLAALKETQALYKESSEDRMKDFGSQLNLMRNQRQAGFTSLDVEERFAELIDQITKALNVNEAQRKEILDEIKGILDQERLYYEDLLNIKPDARGQYDWNALEPSTQRLIEREHEHERANDVESAVRRAKTDEVRGKELDPIHGDAPYGTMPGAENIRQVYIWMGELAALNDKAATEEDPDEKERLKASIKRLEAKIDALLVPLADKAEPGGVGVRTKGKIQIDRDAWAEVEGLIDRLRDGDEIAKTVVLPFATWDKRSWFPEVLKIIIRTNFVLARRALQRLDYENPGDMSGKQEFIQDFARDPDVPIPTDKLQAELDKAKHTLKSLKGEKEDLEFSIKERKQNIADLGKRKVEIDALIKDLTAAIKDSKGGGGRSSTESSLAMAQRESSQTEGFIRKAESELRKDERQLGKITKAIDDLEDPTKKESIPTFEKRLAKPSADPELKKENKARNKEITTTKEEEFKDLRDKLEAFVTKGGKYFGMDFNKVFSNREIDLIARLNDTTSSYDTRNFVQVVNLPTVSDGTIVRSDSSTIELDYALVDIAAAVDEQENKLSTLIHRQVLDPENDRFADIQALRAKKKAVIFGGFVSSPEIGANMQSAHPSGGINADKLKEMKGQPPYNGDALKFYRDFLDDLVMQRQANAYVDEKAHDKYTWMARMVLLRHDFFPADEDWTFLVLGIETETDDSIESFIKRMAHRPLTSTTMSSEPFANTLDRSNEIATTLIKDKPDPTTGLSQMLVSERYRADELIKSPTTFLELYHKVTLRRFALYKQRLKIGGQATAWKRTNDDGLISKRGATIEAYGLWIDHLQGRAEDIVNAGGLSDIDKLRNYVEFHDKVLNHVSYDILNEAGDPVEGSASDIDEDMVTDNKDLFRYWLNETRNWGGKLNSGLKKERAAYAWTQANRNERNNLITVNTDVYGEPLPAPMLLPKVDRARERYVAAAAERIKKVVITDELGRQALGLFPERDENTNRILAEHQAKKFMNSVMDELLRGAELLMRARVRAYLEVRSDSMMPGANNAEINKRRWIGALSRTAGIQEMRRRSGIRARRRMRNGVAAVQNIAAMGGNPALRDPDQMLLADWELSKTHRFLMWYLAAHISEAIQTGNLSGQIPTGAMDNEYKGLLFDFEKDDDADVILPQLNMSKALEQIIDVLKSGAVKEGADTTDRDTKADLVDGTHTPRRERGYNVYEFFEKLMGATLVDSQHIDPATGEARMFGGPKTQLQEFLDVMLRYIEHNLVRSDEIFQMHRVRIMTGMMAGTLDVIPPDLTSAAIVTDVTQGSRTPLEDREAEGGVARMHRP